MDKDKLVTNVNGENVTYDIYFTLVCNELGKGYIAYTDHSTDDSGKENVFVSSYDPNVGTNVLNEVQTQEEWNLINVVIEKIQNL